MALQRSSLLFVTMTLLCATTLFAQEEPITFDSAGTVFRIDADLESRLRLFSRHEGFEYAELFRLPDATYVLEIRTNVGGQVSKSRVPLSAADYELLRRRFGDSVAARSASTHNQEGRASLVAGSTLLSIGFYGWAIPEAFGAEDKGFIAGYTFTVASGFIAPYLLTSRMRVTHGDAAMANGAGALGIAHGVFLSMLMNGANNNFESSVGYGTVTSLAEFIGGYYLADGTDMSAGTANMITLGGACGTLMGTEAAGFFDLYDDDPRAAGAVVLGLSGLGYLVGNALAHDQSYTPGDVSVATGVTMLGAFIPLAVNSLVDPDFGDSKTVLGTSFLGSAAGLGIGHLLVRGKDFSVSDGTYIGLGELSGAALGVAITYLASSAHTSIGAYFSGAALGGIGGFSLMYALLGDNASSKGMGSNWNVNVAPTGLVGLLAGDRAGLPKFSSVPIVHVGARF